MHIMHKYNINKPLLFYSPHNNPVYNCFVVVVVVLQKLHSSSTLGHFAAFLNCNYFFFFLQMHLPDGCRRFWWAVGKQTSRLSVLIYGSVVCIVWVIPEPFRRDTDTANHSQNMRPDRWDAPYITCRPCVWVTSANAISTFAEEIKNSSFSK